MTKVWDDSHVLGLHPVALTSESDVQLPYLVGEKGLKALGLQAPSKVLVPSHEAAFPAPLSI